MVLKGALALAVPTVMGQNMTVRRGASVTEKESDRVMVWRSYYQDKCWFEGKFNIHDLGIIRSSDDTKATFIAKLLAVANRMNPDHLSGSIQ